MYTSELIRAMQQADERKNDTDPTRYGKSKVTQTHSDPGSSVDM
jgi:hypothetical protein